MSRRAEASDGNGRPEWRRSRLVRGALSVLLVVHLWAVVAEPLRFASRGPTGPSPAAIALHRPVASYAEFAYLNHGYAFFAPNPGPSHLVRARWNTAEGDEATEVFPDRTRQWPRLLYHRHFMLTEFLHNLHQPRDLPLEAVGGDRRAYAEWRDRRRLYEAVEGSFAAHLESRYGASEVRIERVEHRMPVLPEFFEEQVRLDDPRLYRTLPDGLEGPADLWDAPAETPWEEPWGP